MDISEIKFIDDSKYYISVKFSDHREIFSSKFQETSSSPVLRITEETLEEIVRLSGIPRTLSTILKKQDESLWEQSVIAMCEYYYSGEITLLVEGDMVTHVSFKKVPPLLNTEFFRIMSSLLEDYKDILTVDSLLYEKDSYLSTLLVYPSRDYEYQGRVYTVGVQFQNDELDTVTCRLVVRSPDLLFYLPPRYYSLSASRYLRTSATRAEALSQLVLKVVEDISKDSWYNCVPEIDMNIRNCMKIQVTYEEFKQSCRLLKRIAADSELDSVEVSDMQNSLEERFVDFEQNYPMLEDKKSSYIWRCSALSESSIYELLLYINTWIQSSKFYPLSVQQIMELVGEFVMVTRISTNLARRV